MIVIRIGFIGAGKVGFSFGRYLHDKGIQVSGYYSKNPNSSREAAAFTNTKFYLSSEELVENSDAIFVTTPDSEIPKVWETLKELSIKDKLICHCSGALSSEIFSDISKLGAYSYSLHPMFALSDKYNSYKKFNEAFFTLEGDALCMEKVINLLKQLGNSYKVINKEDKSLYHLAAVMSSNLVVGLVNCGFNYLNMCGFEEKEALAALKPLILNNINCILEEGTIKSLTGPLERGDLSTIKAHLNVIPKKDEELYKNCTKNLISIAENKNPNRNYNEIQEYLEGKGNI